MFSIMAIDHLMDILNAWVLFRNTKLIKVFSNSLLTFAYSLCCFYLLLCGWMHRIILKLECSKLYRQIYLLKQFSRQFHPHSPPFFCILTSIYLLQHVHRRRVIVCSVFGCGDCIPKDLRTWNVLLVIIDSNIYYSVWFNKIQFPYYFTLYCGFMSSLSRAGAVVSSGYVVL